MPPTCVILVAALSKRMLDLAPADGPLAGMAKLGTRTIQPVLPAVTCTMQATLTTGVTPDRHGIIANGLFLPELGRVSFWEQSNRLLDVPRFWSVGQVSNLSEQVSNLSEQVENLSHQSVAMLFWQNSMFGAADIVVTPRPIHSADGKTLSSCYTTPADLYDQLAGKLGQFELKSYWGPFASLASSQWIAGCAIEVWNRQRPQLQFVYLPHLDYPLQKLGPGDAAIAGEVAAVDRLIGSIAAAVEATGGQLVVMGDYGIVPARRAVLPNVALREAGLLKPRTIGGAELIEVGELDAFAMVDHQIAHVRCAGERARRRAREVLSKLDGVAEVLDLTESDPFHLRHARSGDLVALAEPDTWFAYYWWTDPAVAPPFARTVDIHRKPGYDPCELFIDPAARAISLNTSLVKGTHGLLPTCPADQPILLAGCPLPTDEHEVPATAVAALLTNVCKLTSLRS